MTANSQFLTGVQAYFAPIIELLTTMSMTSIRRAINQTFKKVVNQFGVRISKPLSRELLQDRLIVADGDKSQRRNVRYDCSRLRLIKFILAAVCGHKRDSKIVPLNQTIGELDIENFFSFFHQNVAIAIATFVPSRKQFVRQHKTLQSPSAISIDGRGKIPDATNNRAVPTDIPVADKKMAKK